MTASSSHSPTPCVVHGPPHPGIARRAAEDLTEERHHLNRSDRDRSTYRPKNYLKHLQRLGLLETAAPHSSDEEIDVHADVVRNMRRELDSAYADEAHLLATYDEEDRSSNRGSPIHSRNGSRGRKQRRPAGMNLHSGIAAKRIHVVASEAKKVLCFDPELEIFGVTPSPVHAMILPSERGTTHHGIIGLLGSQLIDRVGADCSDAQSLIAAHFDAQRPEQWGHRPTINHIGHAILSKPLTSAGPVQRFTDDMAMRQSAYILAGIGAAFNQHDAVVFLHSELTRQKNGELKLEECIHVVWCLRRYDGLILVNRFQSIAARVAQARYDNYAGMNPERMSVSTNFSKPIYAGIERLKEGTLAADYVDPKSRAIVEHVPLQGPQHLARIAREGAPIPGDVTGCWIPKPGYRDHADVQRLLTYLGAGC
jgi:hypothetical protein